MAADLVILALLFLSGKKGGKTSAVPTRGRIFTPSELLKRAIQPKAAAWAPYFIDVGETPATADVLARWSGLESSGDPSIVSVLGERGLLQVGTHTRAEGGITNEDWAALINHETLPNTHARIASQYAHWLYARALKHLNSPTSDPVGQKWFAYLYHQRPKDFTEWGRLPSEAPAAAAYLRSKAVDKPHLGQRVIASNIVAWGTPDAPMAGS